MSQAHHDMTGGEILILGKAILTFGFLLGFLLWELFRMRHDLREIRQRRRAREEGQ